MAGRVLLSVLGQLHRKGRADAPLLPGLPFDLDALRSRGFRVDWEDFLVFWGRAEAALGGLAEMEQMGLEMVQSSLAMNLLGRLFVTPAKLYLQMAPKISRSYYSCIQTTSHEQEDGRLVFEGRLYEGYEMPLSFCAATQGLMRAYPRLLGLAEAQVESRYDTRAFCFCITPPPSRALLGHWSRYLQPLPQPMVADQDFEPAAPEELTDLLSGGPGSGQNVQGFGARLQEAESAAEVAAVALDLLEQQVACRNATIWMRTPDGSMAVIGTRIAASRRASCSRLLEVGRRVVGRLDADAAVLGPESPARADLEALLPWVGLALARWLEPDPDSDRAVAALARKTGLTAREAEILKWLREGKTNPEIGVICGISPRTVQKHVEHVLGKVGVETRQAAALRTFSRD